MLLEEMIKNFIESEETTFEGEGYSLEKVTLTEDEVKAEKEDGTFLFQVTEGSDEYVRCLTEEKDEDEEDSTAETDEEDEAEDCEKADKKKKKLKEDIVEKLIYLGADKVTAIVEAGNIIRQGYVNVDAAVAEKAQSLNLTNTVFEYNQNLDAEIVEKLQEKFDVETDGEYHQFKYHAEDLDFINSLFENDVTDHMTKVDTKSFRRIMEEAGFTAESINDLKVTFDEAVAQKEEQIKKASEIELGVKMEEMVERLVNTIDDIATESVNTWIAANLEGENGLIESIRYSKAEAFIEDVKDLLGRHNLSLNEDETVDLENALKKVAALEEENATIKSEAATLQETLEEANKSLVIESVSEKFNLSFSQKEKLVELAEAVVMNESTEENISSIAENYFGTFEEESEDDIRNEVMTESAVTEIPAEKNDPVLDVLQIMQRKIV